MLNQCILVGKVISINEVKDEVIITLGVTRSIKDPKTLEYDTDYIDIELSNTLKGNALEYLNVDATVGVKARIAQRDLKIGETTIKVHAIIAEKLTFINTKKYED